MTGQPLLSVEDIHASYGKSHVLRGVSLAVEEGKVVSLLGRNGAGKTTTLRSIVGVLQPTQGSVVFDGESITGHPDYEIANRGISYVPEDRQIFPDLTVTENLRMSTISGDDGDGVFDIEEAFEQFPRLRERRSQSASQLSGGEQQMLVIARALLSETKLLLLDEPTEGLAPQIVEDVVDIMREIRDRNIPTLLVEQNINAAMAVADYHYIINKGQIAFEGSTEELKAATDVQEEYLGVGADISRLEQ